MKKLILGLAALISAGLTKAQVANYGFTQQTGVYTPITGGTVVATATANTSAGSLDSYNYTFPTGSFPFGFVFNGVSYTGLNINGNGFITFGSTLPTTGLTTPISSATGYNGAVAAFAGDLNSVFNIGTPAQTGEIRAEVLGTAPNRVIVIQYKNWRPTYSTSTTSAYVINFQIQLFETTNVVQVVYGPGQYLVGSTTTSGTRQIGLRGATNTDFNNRTNSTSISFSTSVAGTANNSSQAYNTNFNPPGMPFDGLTYQWTPPPPCSGTPNAGTAVSSASAVCAALPVNLNLTGSTNALGLTYQWYSSPDGIAWTAITNATTIATPQTVTATTYYQAVVSCGANTATSTSVMVNYGLAQNAGNTTATSTLVCPNSPVTFSLSGSTVVPGLTYQWYSSPNGTNYTAITNATLINTTQSVSANTFYQNILTCGTATSASNPIQITTLGTTTNNVPYFESFEGITTNNQLPNCSWAASNLPSICRTYTAATGSYNQFANTGTKFASFRYGTAAGGDYFYSNGIQLTAGVTYSASVKYITDGLSGWSEFSMLLGPNQSTTGLAPIASVTGAITNTTYATLANTFSVASSGIYYLAVKCIGNFTPWYFTWDDLSVNFAPVDDAGAQALVNPGPVGCYSSSEPVGVTIKNFGSNSITNVPVTVTVTGAGSAVLSGTYTGIIPPTGTVNFVVGNLNMSAAGVYSFNAQTYYPGDTGPANDMLATVTRTVVAALPLAYSQDFNASTALPAGFTATNYFVYTNHGAGYNNNALSYNLYGSSSTVAIVTTPKFTGVNANSQLTYDYRIQDWSGYPTSNATSLANWANDSLNVYISTNCGLSYTLVQSNNASNHTPTTSMTTKTVNLAPYAGSDIIVRFIAKKPTSGTGDYYADLDNINITAPLNDDVGAMNLASPGVVGCYSSSEQVDVIVKNHGLLPQTNIAVTVTVSGAASQVLNTTYTGTIAPGATVSVPVGTLNMLAAGVYSFNAATSLTGDMQPLNDAMAVQTRTVIAALALPYAQDFNASLTLPAGMTSTNYYVAGSHGANYNNNALTYNLYGTFSTMGSVTLPKLGSIGSSSVLKFDYRIQDWSSYPNSSATTLSNWANDSLNVLVSTNCGLTYSMVQSINASNHNPTTGMTTKQVNLGAFAGSDVVLRFVAKKDPSGTGDYYLDIDNINICSAPSAPVASSVTACSGNSVSLVASAGTGTVQWYATSTPTNALSTGSVYATPVLSTTTTYYVSETNSCSESSLTAVNIAVNPTPTLVVSATNPTVCQGGSTPLNVSGATTYTWSNGANGNITAVMPSTTTTYTVNGESLGCVGTETVEVFVNALPSVSLTSAANNACVNGSTVALNGMPTGGVYTGSNVSNGLFNPGSVAGTFTANYSYTDPNTSCSNAASVTIVVNAAPTVSLTAATTTACTNGPTIALSGSPSGGVYSGTGVANGMFTPPSAQGTYVAVYSYTDSVTGCDANANTSIVVSVCTDISKVNSSLAGLQVYPNPNSGLFTIELNNGAEKNIVVTDLTGRVIITELSSDDKTTISLNDFANGVYFVKITSNNSVETIRVIKQ